MIHHTARQEKILCMTHRTTHMEFIRSKYKCKVISKTVRHKAEKKVRELFYSTASRTSCNHRTGGTNIRLRRKSCTGKQALYGVEEQRTAFYRREKQVHHTAILVRQRKKQSNIFCTVQTEEYKHHTMVCTAWYFRKQAKERKPYGQDVQ